VVIRLIVFRFFFYLSSFPSFFFYLDISYPLPKYHVRSDDRPSSQLGLSTPIFIPPPYKSPPLSYKEMCTTPPFFLNPPFFPGKSAFIEAPSSSRFWPTLPDGLDFLESRDFVFPSLLKPPPPPDRRLTLLSDGPSFHLSLDFLSGRLPSMAPFISQPDWPVLSIGASALLG